MSLLINEAKTKEIADDIAQSLRRKVDQDIAAAFEECEIAIIRNNFADIKLGLSSSILQHMKGLTIGQALEVVREARISLSEAA